MERVGMGASERRLWIFRVFRDFRSHSSCGHGAKTSFAGSHATFQGWADARQTATQRHVPRIVHGFTLVLGGVTAGLAYEVASRPWDVARKIAEIERVQALTAHRPRRYVIDCVARKISDDGLLSFFRDATVKEEMSSSSPWRQRLHTTARTIGRVGPWGVGFLVWEAFGPGISIAYS